MSDQQQWVSITEAATRLSAAGDTVDRSTLSRYLKQHAEALTIRADGKANLVYFEALAAHRRENIRIRSLPLDVRPHVAGARPSRIPGSQSDGVARKVQADAEMREMDLATRRKELTPTAEVDQAGRDAIALMQSSFERAVETEAAGLSVKYGWDERVTRIALKAFARRGLEVFNREIRDRLDAGMRHEAAAASGRAEAAGSAAMQ